MSEVLFLESNGMAEVGYSANHSTNTYDEDVRSL